MKAIRAIYHNGKVKLSQKPTDAGPTEVLIVFPEPDDDPWEAILAEKTPRPSFAKFVEECRGEIRKGKAKPLRLRDL
jgi:hypothetical protein